MKAGKTLNLVDLVDLLDAEIEFANGVQAAIVGLQSAQLERKAGVVELVEAHIARLGAIRSKVDEARP